MSGAFLKVVLVIRPQRAELLCQRLMALGWVDDLAAIECRGYGRQKGHLEDYQGGEYAISFLPKVLITGCIPREKKAELIDLVCSISRTGRIGDGKIFFVPLEGQVEAEL